MDEKSALQLCLLYHDPAGFEFLVKKYRREAYYHAVSFLGNKEDAADACQESFARAFSAIPRLTHLEAFYPWFYRILRNCCLNVINRKKTAHKYRVSRQHEVDERSDYNDPSEELDKKEEKQQVWRILQSLQPDAREILIMKYVQGYHYDEISELLDIPRGTVMSRLYHARKAFRVSYLKEQTGHDMDAKGLKNGCM